MIRALTFILAYVLVSGPVFAEDVDTAIVFVVDISGSMRPDEVAFARRSHADAIVSREVVEAITEESLTGKIAAAYVDFGSAAWVRIDWTIIDGPDSAASFATGILKAPQPSGSESASTMIGAGLLIANGLLERLPHSAAHLVVEVVGDGTANDLATLLVARDAILARDATINALPLMVSPDSPEIGAWYADYVAGGSGHFSWPVTDIRQMPDALRSKILLELF